MIKKADGTFDVTDEVKQQILRRSIQQNINAATKKASGKFKVMF